jgi:hypothetical protein
MTNGTAAGTYELTGINNAFTGSGGLFGGSPIAGFPTTDVAQPPDFTVFKNEVLFDGLDAARRKWIVGNERYGSRRVRNRRHQWRQCGRERKAVLDALREELRKHNYLPILFDFELPERRNVTETVTQLARMARFIIADLTAPSSIPQELQAIIPSCSRTCSTAIAVRQPRHRSREASIGNFFCLDEGVLGVANRVLDVLVAKIRLQCPGVVAPVSKRVAAGLSDYRYRSGFFSRRIFTEA